MLKLQYDLNNAPINIYVDRPNPYLAQLKDINVKFYIIGKYNNNIPDGFTKIRYFTPDIKPNIVLSQSKLQNFEELVKLSKDWKIPLIHYELSLIPTLISKNASLALKNVRANVNIFSSKGLMANWGFEESESLIIPIGVKEYTNKITEKLYHISTEVPIFEMAKGICPLVLYTPDSRSIIQNGYNGFLYRSESDISDMINKISKMDEYDVRKLGKNAKETIIKQFPYSPYLNSWKKLLRSMI